MRYNDTSYKFYLHKVKKDEKEGYVYLQKIKNRDRHYESLGLPKIKEDYWNPTTQRVRERKGIDYQYYNETIENKLKELTSSFDYPFHTREERKSFISFFERYLNSPEMMDKHGTRIKYLSVLNKIKKHLNSEDLLFSDLNLEYLRNFQVFCRTEGMNHNTIIHYLKILRIIIRKSQRTEGYYDVRDPFINFTFPRIEKKTKEFLESSEIQKIIRKKIKTERLNKVRNLFLFQLFSKGMRVSDLITLRYNNLVNGRIQYQMFKTSNPSDLPISLLHLELLEPFVEFKTELKDIRISKNWDYPPIDIEKLREKRGIKVPLTEIQEGKRPTKRSPISGFKVQPFKNLPYLIDLFNSFSHTPTSWFSNYEWILNHFNIQELQDELSNLIEFQKSNGHIKVHGEITKNLSTEYDKLKDDLTKYIELVSSKINQVRNIFLEMSIQELNQLGMGERKNDFVFGLLKNEEFSMIGSNNDFSFITEDQYKRMNKVSIVYNRNLKELQKLVGLNKTLKSHLPRISYTNLMLNLDGVSPYDIMEGLSHSSLSITDVYLRTGFRKDNTDRIQRNFESKYS